MRKRIGEDDPAGAPEWMCTFSDMMSLLLCFFVLLFALSTVEEKKMTQAAGSLKQAFGGQPAEYVVPPIPDRKTEPLMSRPAQTVKRTSYAKDELLREEQHKIKALNLQNVIQVFGTEQGITFRLSGDVLFERGESALQAEGIAALEFVADELIQFPSNPVKIDGHTDNTNLSGDPRVNWRLGADRAYTVMKFLTEMGSPAGQVQEERVSYESFGEHMPLPGADNNTAIGRKQNRRVEITLIQTDEGDGTYFRNPHEKDPRTPLIRMDSQAP
ncbi:MAG TPA: flagellar motor protein MotB [bacterium]|mgnify:FL=1|nr:flagellar motor protein MotB [Candidatus Omnitrophota bacterium]HOJ59266.1 flagellar motor protein MotB [bacterium]HOL94651.1 flagellar motor protein MotB [bacterium]HPP02102.1 flagellar motor protein MotB [bacterium]